MYDQMRDEHPTIRSHDDTIVDGTHTDIAFAETIGDQTGLIADFIRNQPVLTLSIAFGLGLLTTSLLARKRS